MMMMSRVVVAHWCRRAVPLPRLPHDDWPTASRLREPIEKHIIIGRETQ